MKILTALCDNLESLKTIISKDASKIISGDSKGYIDAIITYLSLMINRVANQNCKPTRWNNVGETIAHVFAMQSLEMKWEYVESNPFAILLVMFCESSRVDL